LQKDYVNLICVDFICHGVPSLKAWRKYLDHQESINGLKPEKISFRSKECGWPVISLLIQYSNKKTLSSYLKDSYFIAFNDGMSLRTSCHHCNFRMLNDKSEVKTNFHSDITIADFVRINQCYPEMFDGKGTSLVFINSDKGRELFDIIKNNCTYIPVDLELAVESQQISIPSNKDFLKRKLFFIFLDILPFDMLVKCIHFPGKFFRKIKHFLIKINQ
jgi:hypothetical protein